MRSTPSPQSTRRLARSISVEEEPSARSDVSPVLEDSAGVSSGLVHMRELAAARVEIAQLQHHVARLQKQLFRSQGGQLSDAEEDELLEEPTNVQGLAPEGAAKPTVKRPSVTLTPAAGADLSRESAV
jgi:hypothetical protein